MNRVGLLIYLLLLFSSILVIVMRVQDGVPLETNILALLPQTEEADWIQKAEAAERSRGSDQFIALVGHPDFETARSASVSFGQMLVDAGVLQSVVGGSQTAAF
ncbi:MAG: hypothetical protein K9G33_09470, partial [Sneathiella sp.]|nr:hypothetical protein [Sneathiella sp.]